MPDGRTHAKFTALTAVAVMALAATVDATSSQVVSVGAGALLGLLIHPDLDQAESRRDLWSMVWYPYGLVVKHRSWVSHAPLISTVIRIGYIISIIYVAWWLLVPRFPWLSNIPNWEYEWILAGLAMADFVHIVLDVVVSGIKRIGGNDEVFVRVRNRRDY